MNCERSGELLSAHLDGELSAWRRWRLERHLAGCAACRERLAALRATGAAVRRDAPRYAAAPELRERVRALVANAPSTGGAARVERPRWQWLAGSALAGSAATIAALVAGNLFLAWLGGDALVAEAVDDHVRATLDSRQIEVASSDQHTVKPWLSARLDYSPPVPDLAAEGYILVGGRLDTLHGRRVATLVYRYRLHTIDVFVRPAPAAAPGAARVLRGFNVTHASGGGMDFLAVSDVNPDVLHALVERMAKSDAAESRER